MKNQPGLLRTIYIISLLVISKLVVAADMEIYFIDVEQADATLIVSPSGNTLLIDSGKNGMGDRIKAIMVKAGVTKIDHFVATHYHEDHYGGIDDLIKKEGVTVSNGYDRGDKQFIPKKKLKQPTYKDYDSQIGSRAQHLMRGETIDLDPEVLVSVISSGGAVFGEENATHGHDENDMSISLLVQYGDFQLFVGGDIESFTEDKIFKHGFVKDIDIYQANHHGSHTSSSTDFVGRLIPSVVVISNGNTRDYQHPRKVTFETLDALSPSPLVFQTNKYVAGGPDFGNTADDQIADLPPNDKNGTIHVAVNKDTKKFNVNFGSTSETFNIKVDAIPQGLVIHSLVPNPVGSDYKGEEITLKNKGSSNVSLNGMRVIDESGRLWLLEGEIPAGNLITIRRNRMPMSLTNDGDTIRLLAANGATLDEFSYSGVQSAGNSIQTNH